MQSTISFSFTPSAMFSKAKGKKSIKQSSSPVLASSPISTSDASDNEDEAYFSDVSSTSSRASSSSSSPVLGDFTFASDEEFQDYYAIVTGQVSEQASPSTSYSSSPSLSSSSSSGKPSRKTSSKQSKTRKGSSAFFLSGSSFSSSPSLSPSLASQNPELSRAHSKLSQKLQRLASLSYQAEKQEESSEEDVDSRFERALMFAEWTRNANGQWQTPAGANETLVKLVNQAL